MTDTLILTGWGWKEYAVAAAVVPRAHHGDADVLGVSKRRLPELLEELDVHYKKIAHGTTPASGLFPEDLEDDAIHSHVRRIYEKSRQHLMKAVVALMVTRNTVRKYLK